MKKKKKTKRENERNLKFFQSSFLVSVCVSIRFFSFFESLKFSYFHATRRRRNFRSSHHHLYIQQQPNIVINLLFIPHDTILYIYIQHIAMMKSSSSEKQKKSSLLYYNSLFVCCILYDLFDDDDNEERCCGVLQQNERML